MDAQFCECTKNYHFTVHFKLYTLNRESYSILIKFLSFFKAVGSLSPWSFYYPFSYSTVPPKVTASYNLALFPLSDPSWNIRLPKRDTIYSADTSPWLLSKLSLTRRNLEAPVAKWAWDTNGQILMSNANYRNNMKTEHVLPRGFWNFLCTKSRNGDSCQWYAINLLIIRLHIISLPNNLKSLFKKQFICPLGWPKAMLDYRLRKMNISA